MSQRDLIIMRGSPRWTPAETRLECHGSPAGCVSAAAASAETVVTAPPGDSLTPRWPPPRRALSASRRMCSWRPADPVPAYTTSHRRTNPAKPCPA
jgi:hypothetical protein